ncbi:hypothetical protein AJ80_05943 [Polytolypa hystricis UAMH7299]|uniref:Beta-glucuronidase C-terminal domain-containing protein n=1 Tax=Polytolypa hystricis (strain UAMH7299) TaxID=1447883 RepID=A0A2B7XZZ8_POLH7|nr:hypothetical protein AJ80_05943 [Polytolypa hystricis UAMH7299]
MHAAKATTLAFLGQAAFAFGITFNVPATPPSNASPQLVAAPIGVSLEFFTFPGYMNDVAATSTCLRNLGDLFGEMPPVRIGGTTQDRATYDAGLSSAVDYYVANPADAPASLTFGPSFMSLAGSYGGKVTLGLNRRLNNQANTIAAAQVAIQRMNNLYAIELGNEPNFYSGSDPIAGGSWDAGRDRTSQVSWQRAVGNSLSNKNILQGGVFFGVGDYSVGNLIAAQGDAGQYVNSYCTHNYPQSSNTANLAALMSHNQIASQISPWRSEVAAAASVGKPLIMGETNSATQGGGGISPTFGAALWVMDYIIQAVSLGIESLFFHQGTIGNCQYCWWGRYSMGAPYYGAYFAAMAIGKADKIAPLDDFRTAYGAYAIYENNRPVRVLLYNSDFYTSGNRGQETFTLTGLTSSSQVTAKRLTAPNANSRQDRGENPNIAGRSFTDGTCVMQGTETVETVAVSGGQATFTVAASEALLVYL